MAEVKCIALYAVPLPSGRMLPPGRRARDVDLDDPEVVQYIESGALLVIDEPVPDGSAKDVLAWVGDDSARAAVALAAEQDRGEPRATLIDKLKQLVATTTEN